ncbi:hypothetical protein R3I93_007959 [Phoxinus phoxinus]
MLAILAHYVFSIHLVKVSTKQSDDTTRLPKGYPVLPYDIEQVQDIGGQGLPCLPSESARGSVTAVADPATHHSSPAVLPGSDGAVAG